MTRAIPVPSRRAGACALSLLALSACGRATLEDEAWTPLSRGRAGSAGAQASAGAAGSTQKAGAAGAAGSAQKAGAAGAGIEPFVRCDVLGVEGPVDVGPAVGARATQLADDQRVVLSTWELDTQSNAVATTRLVDAWGEWPPAISAPSTSQFSGPLPPLVLAPGGAPSSYVAVTAPLVDSPPGQLLMLSTLGASGTLLSAVELGAGEGVRPVAAARSGGGHAVLSELAPYSTVTTVDGGVPSPSEPLGCATSEMVGDVAQIGGAPWVLFASSRPLGTCSLDDGVVGPPSMLLLARVSPLASLGVITQVEGDELVLARLLPAPTGALVAHRYAGAHAGVQPGVSLRRLSSDGETTAGPVEILSPFAVQAAGLGALGGALLVARRGDGATLELSTHAPEAGAAPLRQASVSSPVSSVELVVTEPGGRRALVGWTGGQSARIARVTCFEHP